MPAATVTPQAIDWDPAYVISPDAFYQRAFAHLNRDTNVVDVYNLQGVKQASYTAADGYTWNESTKELKGVTVDGGELVVRPDSGCRCHGYKRTAR